MRTEEVRFANALKSIARDQQLKAAFQQSKEFYPVLKKGAKRFVAGETRAEGIGRVMELKQQGYEVSIEFIGENTTSEAECALAKDEFKSLIKDLGARQLQATVSFDLSHIGMMVSEEVALAHLTELAEEADKHAIQLMISMEESQKTDQILSIYHQASRVYSNVGITLQVHLKRSAADLQELLKTRGRIRLVKGAYQEPDGVYIPRSEELNTRYREFVAQCAEHPLSIATHDEALLIDLKDRGYLNGDHVEVEMLDGVRPDLRKQLNETGVQTKVYVTYGSEWYLYVLHRIAEHPPNLYTLVADCVGQVAGE